jgi:DNA-binding beta-propeller fold protein YncE
MLNKSVKVAALAALSIAVAATANAQSVKSSIALPGVPEGIGVNSLTNRIYVALPNFDNVSDSLAVIDGKTDTVIGTLTIPPVAQNVAVDEIRDLVYVAGTYFDAAGVEQSKVVVLNGRTNKILRVIPISTTEGSGIEGLAVNSFTGEIYVSNASDNVIDVILPLCDKIEKQISVDESPYGVTVNPFNNQVYVALSNGTVDVIDGRRKTVTTSTSDGSTNAGIAVNWATGNVFVTNNVFGTSTVGILDKKGAVITDVTVGNTPFGVDVDFLTNLAFVTNTQDGTVSIIDGKTNTVQGFLPVTGLYVAANPVTSKVYVGGQDNSVTVVKEK